MQQRATVGKTVVIKGELLAKEDVVIAGRVEGTINVAGHLVLVEEFTAPVALGGHRHLRYRIPLGT